MATTSSFMSAEIRNLKRVNEIGFAGMADLALVLLGREEVGPADQLEVRFGLRAQLFEQRFESNHDARCLRPGSFGISTLWP